ncbi:MAG: PD40 domain-containing protein [Acidobacteriaceae bacterium]|nr:PD40 domain-containing protein [Acidobacteriaceae bacterium]
MRRLEVSGAATAITSQELEEERGFSHAEFSVSRNGILVFQSLSESSARLVWFDFGGKELGHIGEAGYRDPRLSRDGRFLAVSSDDARNGKFSIRVIDLSRGMSTRLTEARIDHQSHAWSPDGKTITYRTPDAINNVRADRSSPPQVLLKGDLYLGHMDWSPDGHLVFTDFSGGSPALNIYSAADRRVTPFAFGCEARFSPDGKWIAYVGPLTVPDSDAIFIAPFPGPGERIRVASGSGAQPNWDPDGRRLFYIAPNRKLMAVEFDARTASASAPHVLFQTRITAPNFADTQYSVSRDGRFLINSFPANASSPLTLITGWTSEVNSRAK